jgi:hypothetical protein
MRRFALLMALTIPCFLSACSDKGRPLDASQIDTMQVKFPDGFTIRAEIMVREEDLFKGMKFRPSLAEDRGMIFMHGKEDFYPYWMYEVLVPLDLIWLDKDRRIVQLIHQAPPCPGPREKCLSYGGQFKAIFVLEVPAGTAAKHGLKPGMQLEF